MIDAPWEINMQFLTEYDHNIAYSSYVTPVCKSILYCIAWILFLRKIGTMLKLRVCSTFVRLAKL